MDLLMMGTDHRTAELALRERLIVPVDGLPAALTALAAGPGVAEVVLLSTCNRVEIYAVATEPAAAERSVARFAADRWGVDLPPAWGRTLTGPSAAVRMCRVAAGLESLVLGEAEIAGQFRRAVAGARAVGAAGACFDRLAAGAFRAVGRTRSETSLSRGSTSVAGTAVALAEHVLGTLAGHRVVVAGAGCVGREALSRAAPHGPAALTVLSRSARHAREAAGRHGGAHGTLDALPRLLDDTDVVILAVRTHGWRLRASEVRRALDRRDSRPLVIVDLSVPRCVEPDAGDLAGVTLRTVDDLGELAAAAAVNRRRAVPAAEAICRDEAGRAYARFRAFADRRARAGAA
jgi:glutamyl-tRNA reductase